MADETWYVDPDGTAVNWGSAVSGGVAVTAIYRVVQRDDIPWPQVYAWRAAGRPVTAAEIAEAVAETSGDAIPDPYEPPPPDTGGGGGAPTGPAGGDLTGTYPDPTVGAGKVTPTKLDRAYDLSGVAVAAVAAIPSDGADAVASVRTLGTGAAQAAKGNHGHARVGPRLVSVLVNTGTAGGDTPVDSSSTWLRYAPVGGLSIAAAVGDYVEVAMALLTNRSDTGLLLDLAVYVSGSAVWYSSSGTAAPATEGDPGLYPTLSTRGWYAGLIVEAGHLSGGTVTFGVGYRGNGTGKLYYSTSYPMRWRALNFGPPAA